MHRLILSLLIAVGLLASAANAELSIRDNPPKADGSVYMWVIPYETYIAVVPPFLKNDDVQFLFANSNEDLKGFFRACPHQNCIRQLFVRDLSTQQQVGFLAETLPQRQSGTGPFNHTIVNRFELNLAAQHPNKLLELEFFHTSSQYPFRARSLEKLVSMPGTLADCADEKLGMTSDILPASSLDVVRLTAQMVVPTQQTAIDGNYGGYNRFYLRAGIDNNDVADELPPWIEVGMEQALIGGFYYRIKTLDEDHSGLIPAFVWATGDVIDFSINNCADSAAGVECFALGATEDHEWEVCASNSGETDRGCRVFTETVLDDLSIETTDTGPGSREAVTAAHSTCGHEQFVQASSKTARMHFTNPVYRTAIPNTPSEVGQNPGFFGNTDDGTAKCCDLSVFFLCEHTENTAGIIKDQVGVQYELESGTALPTQCVDF